MATNQEQPDDLDEARLAWLLTLAHDAPPMRGEFATELAARLDAEFAGQRHGPSHLEQMLAPKTNGHHGPPAKTATTVLVQPAADTAAAVSAPRRRRSRRWTVGVSAAASLLLATAVWSNPPAWANMIRAIVERIERLTFWSAAEPGDGADGTIVIQRDPEASATDLQNVAPPSGVVDVPTVGAWPQDDDQAATQPPAAKGETEFGADEPTWTPFDEPLATGELSERVDARLAARWAAQRIHVVGPASDAEFMRRVYLDLTGRIPTVGEAREFLADLSPARREVLVDRLLAHHDHATHLAAVWRRILLPDEVDLSRLGGTTKFDAWLAERFEANVPYDRIVRELLSAEGRVSESGPLLFYAALRLNPEELAGRTSRAFLGVRMECAQCHDHPFDDVSQHDFWSLAAFFARISRPRGKMEMTSPVLQVRDNQFGDVTIPESDEVVPPRLPLSAIEVADEPDGPSRREQLVEWLTSPNNGHFARATVNRVWAHLFGRGLVEPVDDMRPANPPLCPEVLDTLSRDFAASGFDLRRLIRALVLTETYQLSSRPGDGGEIDPSRGLYFAQMNIKSLTAEQLYDCIAVATGQAAMAGGPGGPVDESGLSRFTDTSRQAFIEQFRAAPDQATDYQAGIPQALTLMHGGLIHNATDVGTSGLLRSLAAPFFSDDQRLETLFLSTLSRYPEPTEREVLLQQIASANNTEARQQVLGDLLWALVNSAEFTLNH